jgi:hypothetical protein
VTRTRRHSCSIEQLKPPVLVELEEAQATRFEMIN